MSKFVRVFALALVATGVFASAHMKNNATEPAMSMKVSAMPAPMCPPNDPNACHISQGN